MDYELAIEEVDRFRNRLLTYQLHHEMVAAERAQPNLLEPARQQLNEQIGIVESVANAIGLASPERLRTWSGGWGGKAAVAAMDAAVELLGLLKTHERRRQILGDLGPQLSAARLHPWVWEEAASRWDAGFYRDAVQAAATRIFDVELPRTLGMQPVKDPADLFSAFNPKTAPRFGTLRFPDIPPEDPSFESVHRGAMLYGQGCVKAIRNPRTHRLVSEEHVALEELAALSLLARWIEEAEFTPPEDGSAK